MEKADDGYVVSYGFSMNEQAKSHSQCEREHLESSTTVSELLEGDANPKQCIKRRFSSKLEPDRISEITREKKRKIDTLNPDNPDLSTPDELEILRSGSKVIYSCNTCRKSSNSLTDFNIHSKKHLPSEKVTFTKFYACSLCMYVCKKPPSLLKHIDKHGKRKYGCEACDYTTNRPSVLKIHMLTHSATRPFACTECSFRALQEGYLRHHYLKKHNIRFE